MLFSKKLLGFICLTIVLTTSGCIDFIEEITLKKDGSGEFRLMTDMSKLFSSPMINGLKKIEEEDTNSNMNLEQDTALIIYDILPDSVKREMKDAEYWKKTTLRVNLSESKGIGILGLSFNFKELSEIDQFYNRLGELDKIRLEGSPTQISGIINMFSKTSSSSDAEYLYGLKKRKFTRHKRVIDGATVFEEEKEAALFKMMLGGAKYKTIYNLPGKVRKASHPNAKIKGKQVTVEVDCIDYIEGKATLENEIKFRKK